MDVLNWLCKAISLEINGLNDSDKSKNIFLGRVVFWLQDFEWPLGKSHWAFVFPVEYPLFILH